MSMQGTLLYHTIIFIILFVSSSAIGRRTTDTVEPLRNPYCNLAAFQLIAGVSRKGSPSARSRRRQHAELSGFFLDFRINVYVAKGTCMHRLHHTLLCKNFEKKLFYGSCQFTVIGGDVPRVLSIVSAQTQTVTGLDAKHWGMNATAVNGDVDK
jgi:hypothetical protein